MSPALFGQTPPKKPQPIQHAVPPPPAVPQEQVLVYWTTEPGWNTELLLRNNMESSDLTVTPALRNSSGIETALPPVTIQPGDVASVNLYKTLINSAPQLAHSWGSVVFRYTARVSNVLYASAMIHADGRPISFHLDAFGRGSKDYEVGSREGIWWLPWDSATDYLILTNSGDQQLQPTLTIFDSTGKASPQALNLSPRQSLRLSIRNLVQQAGLHDTFGGMKIDLAKGARYLDSTYLMFQESGASSAVMKMFRHDPSTTLASRSFGGVQQWTTRAPMLALSQPDPALALPAGTALQPKLFIRNASSKAFTAQLRFNWRSATATGKSQPLPLAFQPNETKLVDVSALQSQNVLPPDANWAAVILSAPVLPDELMAVAASYDSTGRYGAQTPFTDQLASHWEGGQWEVDGMHDSLITINNGGNQPAQAELTLIYNHGASQYQLVRTLNPDDQIGFDFAELIRDRVPDKNGQTLPLDLTSGAYRIRDLNDAPLGSLYEGKVITDKTFGHASYGCMICCGPNNPVLVYSPINVFIDGSADQSVQALNSCNNQLQTITGDFPTWWSGNTSISTTSVYQINGVAVGTTTNNAQSKNMYWGPKEDSGGGPCPLSQSQTSGNTNVTASIANIFPAQGLVGTAESVTISGNGFVSGATTVNAGSHITVSNITVSSSTQMSATFTPANSTSAGGNQAVTVSVNGGMPSNSQNFYVQIPTHIARTTVSGVAPAGPLEDGIGPLVTGTNLTVYWPNASPYGLSNKCGGYQWYGYEIEDQETDPEPITNGTIAITESFSILSPLPPLSDPFLAPSPTTDTLTLPNAYLLDIYGLLYSAPTCPPANASDEYEQQFTAQVGSTQYIMTTVIDITKTTNSQGLPSYTSTISTP